MSAHTYEESKGIAFKTIIILGIVTVVEVLVALTGKGYLIPGFVPYKDWIVGTFNFGRSIMYLAMISMSLYKAMLVVFEFMHMKYEVKALKRSVLLPTMLLVWAIIAFFMEGNYWRESRAEIKAKNTQEVDNSMKPQGETLEIDEVHNEEH